MLVLPIVIPGTGETVKNLPYLLSINVTHVLNTAECDVNVNPKRYTKEGICYKGFRVNDVPHADISQVSWKKVYFALNSFRKKVASKNVKVKASQKRWSPISVHDCAGHV